MDFTELSEMREQEPKNSVLLGFATVIGIVLLVGVMFREYRTSYVLNASSDQDTVSVNR